MPPKCRMHVVHFIVYRKYTYKLLQTILRVPLSAVAAFSPAIAALSVGDDIEHTPRSLIRELFDNLSAVFFFCGGRTRFCSPV